VLPPENLTKSILEPFSRLLREHNLILMTHSSDPVGHEYRGKGVATPEMLYSFISNLNGLPVVCAHWGGGLPFYTLMPEVRRALENVYFDTAISPFLYRPDIYRYVKDLVGADRILFGTDYPVLPPSRLLKEFEGVEMTQDERDMILSGNARRLLGI